MDDDEKETDENVEKKDDEKKETDENISKKTTNLFKANIQRFKTKL